jgi:hypothetical protein
VIYLYQKLPGAIIASYPLQKANSVLPYNKSARTHYVIYFVLKSTDQWMSYQEANYFNIHVAGCQINP